MWLSHGKEGYVEDSVDFDCRVVASMACGRHADDSEGCVGIIENGHEGLQRWKREHGRLHDRKRVS